jgi:predicted ester cyclase
MTQNNSQDQELMNQIQRARAGAKTGNSVVDDLANTVPQANPAFQQQLEDHLVAQLEIEETGLFEAGFESPADSTGDHSPQPQDPNRSSERETNMSINVLPLPRRQERALQGLLVTAVAATVVIAFSIVLLGNLLGNTTNFATVVVDKATLFERYLDEIWNEGNLDTLSLFVTDDHIHHDANLEADVVGIEAVTQYITTNRALLPDLVLTVNQLTADGDRVSGELTASANDLTTTILVNSRFADDKIAEVWLNASAVPVSQEDIEAANMALIERWIELDNAGRLTSQEWQSIFGSNYLFHDYFTHEALRWDWGYYRRLDGYWTTAMPDLQITIDHLVAQGDIVIVHYSSIGTFENPFEFHSSPQPTGEIVEAKGVIITRFEDGQVAELWQYVEDPLTSANNALWLQQGDYTDDTAQAIFDASQP